MRTSGRDAWLDQQVDAPTSQVLSEVLRAEDIVTGDAVVLDIGVASPFIRALAITIDYLVVSVVYYSLAWLIVGWVTINIDIVQPMVLLLAPVSIFVTPMIIEIITKGRSLGKWITGLRVVRDDAGPIRWRHSLSRHLLGLLEIWTAGGTIALTTALVNKRNKRLGDLMAGTVVIQDRIRTAKPWQATTSPECERWASGADLDRIPAPVSHALRTVLKRPLDAKTEIFEQRVGRLLGLAAPYVMPPPPAGASASQIAGAILAESYRRDYDRLERRSKHASSLRTLLRKQPFGAD